MWKIFLQNSTTISLSSTILEKEHYNELFTFINENSISTLILNHNHIREEATKIIGEGLINNKTFTELNLEPNVVGDTGIIFLTEALKVNQTLKI